MNELQKQRMDESKEKRGLIFVGACKDFTCEGAKQKKAESV